MFIYYSYICNIIELIAYEKITNFIFLCRKGYHYGLHTKVL